MRKEKLSHDNCYHRSWRRWNNDCCRIKSDFTRNETHWSSKAIDDFPASKAITIDVSSYDNMNQTFDVIIIAVKTHQLGTVITQLKALAHPDTLIILAQNGYGQVQRIPYQHVHQAVVYISGQK